MTAEELIKALGLQPHPEGGWYKETWRTPAPDGKRPAASAVYYLIQPGQRSHWNRVDADEMWLWHAGDAVDVSMTKRDLGAAHTIRLGGDIAAGEHPQVIVPAGQWQSADPVPGGYFDFTLISCIVAPAFEFKGFELAPPGWAPKG